MFFKLILRSSRRNRKENGLFFSALLISIIAFYMILSLPQQDVMLFLNQVESYAVDRLMALIPVFYGLSLLILFFLIYYASKYQLERRRHEFGVCLTLGMRRVRLFAMLMAEALCSSVFSLAIGLPAAVCLSELVSLTTARLVGIGIVGHQISVSLSAMLWTAAGYLLIQSAAYLLLSGSICRQEIGFLLADMPDGIKKKRPAVLYGMFLLAGIFFLAIAYAMAIQGTAWSGVRQMGLTIVLGLLGTFLFFWGLRFPVEAIIRTGKSNRRLHIFHLRQIQETVIHHFVTLAVCSLLILAALCFFGAGVAISRFYGASEPHVLDYTFTGCENESDALYVRRILSDHQIDTCFSDLFEMKVGYIRTTEDREHAFSMEPLMSALCEMPSSKDTDILLNHLAYAGYPHLISLDSYNQLLAAADMPGIQLGEKEAAVYMDREFTTYEGIQQLNQILNSRPEAMLDQETIRLTGTVQTINLVTDRSITLSFALILPDQMFSHYTQGEYDIYLDGILTEETTTQSSLLSAISDLNQRLNRTGLSYESYLQNIGRQLFYMVAASYITMYLAIIFLIIANTIIGVQFLMSQQKSGRRYRTLIRLGAPYETLRSSVRKQINWYFGIPAAMAACSSLFGVRALFSGILSSRVQHHLAEMMLISAAMIFALCVIEYSYILIVKRSSDRWLLTLMVPVREE